MAANWNEEKDDFWLKYSDSHETLNDENRDKVQNGEAVIIDGLVFDGYPTKEFIKENRQLFNMDAIEKTRFPKAVNVTVWNKDKTAYVEYCLNGKNSYMKLVYGRLIEMSEEQYYRSKHWRYAKVTHNGEEVRKWIGVEGLDNLIFHIFEKAGERTDRKEILEFLAEN